MRIEISGRLTVAVFECGALIDLQRISNIVTSAGRTQLAELARGEGTRWASSR